jgi:hypothetical protein
MIREIVLEGLSNLNYNPYDYEYIKMENQELQGDDYSKGIIKISVLHDDIKTSSLRITEFNNGKKNLNYFWLDYSENDLKALISDFFSIFGSDSLSKSIFDSFDKDILLTNSGILRKWTFEAFDIIIGFSNYGSSMLFVNILEKQ